MTQENIHPLRAFGDIVYIRSRLRSVIRRGRAILDEFEGGRLYTDPGADSAGDSLFSGTAIYHGERAVGRWYESIQDLVAVHLPSLRPRFRSPVPEPRRGVSSHDLLDELDAYVRGTISELETALDSLANRASVA